MNCTPRWKETEKINRYVEENYEYKKLVSKDDILKKLNIKTGTSNVQLVSKRDIIIPVKKDESIEVKIKVPLYEIIAPIEVGEKVGRLDIYSNNKLLFTEALVAKNYVARKNVVRRKFDKILNLITPNK